MTARPETTADGAQRCQALNVVVAGDEVMILTETGLKLQLDAAEAEISGRRLLDAADVARGRLPRARP